MASSVWISMSVTQGFTSRLLLLDEVQNRASIDLKFINSPLSIQTPHLSVG